MAAWYTELQTAAKLDAAGGNILVNGVYNELGCCSDVLCSVSLSTINEIDQKESLHACRTIADLILAFSSLDITTVWCQIFLVRSMHRIG